MCGAGQHGPLCMPAAAHSWLHIRLAAPKTGGAGVRGSMSLYRRQGVWIGNIVTQGDGVSPRRFFTGRHNSSVGRLLPACGLSRHTAAPAAWREQGHAAQGSRQASRCCSEAGGRRPGIAACCPDPSAAALLLRCAGPHARTLSTASMGCVAHHLPAILIVSQGTLHWELHWELQHHPFLHCARTACTQPAARHVSASPRRGTSSIIASGGKPGRTMHCCMVRARLKNDPSTCRPQGSMCWKTMGEQA